MQFQIDTRREVEFNFSGKTYTITYSSQDDGTPCIAFGRLYDPPEKFSDFRDLMNRAKVGNYFLRELI